MISEKKVELTVGPEKCIKNRGNVQELSVIISASFAKSKTILTQFPTLSRRK